MPVSPPSNTRLVLAGRVFMLAGAGLVLLSLLDGGALDAAYAHVRTGPRLTAPLDESARFGAALAGALTIGWGWCIAALAAGRALPLALRQGVLAWFVVDSAASILLGFGGNAFSNLGFLALAWWATRTAGRAVPAAAPDT